MLQTQRVKEICMEYLTTKWLFFFKLQCPTLIYAQHYDCLTVWNTDYPFPYRGMSEITSQKHRQDLQPLAYLSPYIMMQSEVRFSSIKVKSLLFPHTYLRSVLFGCFTVTHFTNSSVFFTFVLYSTGYIQLPSFTFQVSYPAFAWK